MAPAKKSSSSKASAKKPMVVKKSQYELERDARIKRNEEYMLSIGINPYSDGYMKLRTPKSKRHRKRVRVVDDLSDEQRARLAQFNMDDFYASASASFTKPRHRRDSVITLHIYTGFWSPTASTRSPTTTGARSSAR